MKKLLMTLLAGLFVIGGCANSSSDEAQENQESSTQTEESNTEESEESSSNNKEQESSTEESNSEDNASSSNSSEGSSNQDKEQSDSSKEKSSSNGNSEGQSSSNSDESSTSEGESSSSSDEQRAPKLTKSEAKQKLIEYKEAYAHVVNVTEDDNPDNNYETKQEPVNYLMKFMDKELAQSFVDSRFDKRDGEFTILGMQARLAINQDKPISVESKGDATYIVTQEKDNQLEGHIRVIFTLKHDGDNWIVTKVDQENLS
ncbi:hypothetical protein [Pontibacillus yanchengensis]|uniref:Lipoprotein n=1 Tax=Pontibacillus yanchengensis Y32 TaxID=1385514 RepID=A0A0A2TZ15_9BACI|nr:hypothetical protein [Pontibacillus yanchengensis]KGP74510.1 hypothetical protein N782_12400 [Pontibacillus yanchengensis Y32]